MCNDFLKYMSGGSYEIAMSVDTCLLNKKSEYDEGY